MSAVKTRSKLSAAFTILFWLALAAAGGYSLFVASRPSNLDAGVELRNYRMVDDFALTNHHGQPFSRAELEGKVWVADFIFTSCVAECLILSLRMADLAKRYAGHPDVRFVSVSVDPQTDTPERLAKYAERYAAGSNWSFLTGDVRQVDQLVKGSFLLPIARNDAERTQIHVNNLVHSERIAVVDRLGVVRYYAEGLAPTAVDSLSQAIDRLLVEGLPGATKPQS
jgi:protein SCO1